MATRLTQDLKCDGIMYASLQCLIGGLTCVDNAIELWSNVQGQHNTGHSAPMKPWFGYICDSLNRNTFPPPAEPSLRVARAGVTGQCCHCPSLQLWGIFPDNNMVWRNYRTETS